MRVNVYAEEMTHRVEIISKTIDGVAFTGLRLYLELPATVNGEQYQGPFMHRPGDDDSSAVTFWGKTDLRGVLSLMKAKLDEHYIGAISPVQHSIVPDLHEALPTHRCRECGALWRFNRMSETGFDSDTWSLKSPACGVCCDNAEMGSQIVAASVADIMEAYGLLIFDRGRAEKIKEIATTVDATADAAAYWNEERANDIEMKARELVAAWDATNVNTQAIGEAMAALRKTIDKRKA